MRRIFGIASLMILSLLAAFGALGYGFYCLETARAEEALASFDVAPADRLYNRLEKIAAIGGHIPWVLDRVKTDLQLRRSRLTYWRQDYAKLLTASEANGEKEKTLPPSLRFIRANARYQTANEEGNRGRILKELEQCIREYAKIIEEDPSLVDAAFNYEFLLMLRDDIAGGRRIGGVRQAGEQKKPTDQMKGVHGEQGAEPSFKAPQRMKVLVPREGEEEPQMHGPEPGKGSVLKKRG